MVAAVTSYCSPKKLNQILGLKTIAVTLKVFSFLKSIHRRGFLPAENRLKSAAGERRSMGSLLAFKLEKQEVNSKVFYC